MYVVICLDRHTYCWDRRRQGCDKPTETITVTEEPGKVCGEHNVRETAEKHAAKNRKMFKLCYEVRKVVSG